MHTAPTPMATGNVLRSFRSDVLRDLAKRALDQGWDVYPTGHGHLRLVNPATGGMVEMSTSAGGGRFGHDQRNTRVALARAGLDLRPKAERRRDRIADGRRRAALAPIEETPMTTTPAPQPVAPPAPPRTNGATIEHPHARIAGSERSLTVDGRRVQTWRAANGAAWALVGAPGKSPRQGGNKGFSDAGGDEAAIMERVRDYIASGATPVRKPRRAGPIERRQATPAEVASFGHPSGAPAPAESVTGTGGRRPTAPELPAPVPTAGPDPATPAIPPAGGPAEVWASVRVDIADYPIASSLAKLAETIGPAIEALEAAGKGDAAALVRAELATTPAETELLALWREVTGRPRLEHGRREDG